MREQRVELAVIDEPAQVAHSAGECHRCAETSRHDAEQHLNISEAPAAKLRNAPHQYPPEHENTTCMTNAPRSISAALRFVASRARAKRKRFEHGVISHLEGLVSP